MPSCRPANLHPTPSRLRGVCDRPPFGGRPPGHTCVHACPHAGAVHRSKPLLGHFHAAWQEMLPVISCGSAAWERHLAEPPGGVPPVTHSPLRRGLPRCHTMQMAPTRSLLALAMLAAVALSATGEYTQDCRSPPPGPPACPPACPPAYSVTLCLCLSSPPACTPANAW